MQRAGSANVMKGWRTETDSVSTAVGQRWRVTSVKDNAGDAGWKTHVSTAVGQRWRGNFSQRKRWLCRLEGALPMSDVGETVKRRWGLVDLRGAVKAPH